MGFYIEGPTKGKVSMLLKVIGARIIKQPKEWQNDLVCVVDNGAFEAAMYVYDPSEFGRVVDREDDDNRPHVWLTVPGASKLSGYDQAVEESKKLEEDENELFK